MAGDNNLDAGFEWDFHKLETVADNLNLNIIVLRDRAGAGDTVVYEICHDTLSTTIASRSLATDTLTRPWRDD